MKKRTRHNDAPAFKARLAMATIKGEKPLAELPQIYDVHSNQITAWKAQLTEGAAVMFGGAPAAAVLPVLDSRSLNGTKSKLRIGNDFLSSALSNAMMERKAIIDRGYKLPLTRKAALLRLSANGLSFPPGLVPTSALAVTRRIDESHNDYPFAGRRMVRDEDIVVGRSPAECAKTLFRPQALPAQPGVVGRRTHRGPGI